MKMEATGENSTSVTAREKILCAFSREGTKELGVVAGYDSIFIRDHWHALTDVPWWYAWSGLEEYDEAWIRDYMIRCGLEWLRVQPCRPRILRSQLSYQKRGDNMWEVNEATGDERRLVEPLPGGANTGSAASKYSVSDTVPTSTGELDVFFPTHEPIDVENFRERGRHDTATVIRENLGLFTYGSVASPFWGLYSAFGCEGMMLFFAGDEKLIAYAGEKLLSHAIRDIQISVALGADAVWIEECLTDQINPTLFSEINVPLVRKCVEEISRHGMKSIYYYCGNPWDRFDAIIDAGSDAVHFEEGKKHFTIDIDEVVDRVDGGSVVFGNLDAINALPMFGPNELESEIRRQIRAGIRNGGRFVLSTGSPITPGTSVERVKLYTDIAKRVMLEEN